MIKQKAAARLGGPNFFTDTTIYKFEKIKRAKAEARKLNPGLDIIDLGVGEPDKPADPSICEILAKEAGRPENRWYADNGIPEFQNAAAKFMDKMFGVKIADAQKQIIHGIGSKPIFALLPLCFINPGDVSLVTTPGYPVIGTYTRYLGGEVYKLPLLKENSFFPDLTNIPQDILKKAKILYLNYPNNPTGQLATKDFFKEVVDFAKKNEIIVVHDAAYSTIVYDDAEFLSFLSIDGAIDIGIEVQSLSKAYNMTGWRLGFVVGNEKIVKLYGSVKDNTDSGQFRAIQHAGVHALNHPELITINQQRYARRMGLLADALNEVGFSVNKPKGTFYCYTKAPTGTEDGQKFANAEQAAEFLIKKCSISSVPWDDAGNFLRFSVTFEAEKEAEEVKVTDEIKQRLKGLKLVF
jgi:LL-diaminopimelate aminotransferase